MNAASLMHVMKFAAVISQNYADFLKVLSKIDETKVKQSTAKV